MMYRVLAYLCVSIMCASGLWGCATKDVRGEPFSPWVSENTELSAGNVRENIFYALKNTVGIDACFGDISRIDPRVIAAEQALEFLTDINPQPDTDLATYINGLGKYPAQVRAVHIKINDDTRQFIYIPNDGRYGITLTPDDDSLIDQGILVDITGFGRPKKTKTCVTCQVESGFKNEGCTCTRNSQTVCCDTEGCSPTCGAATQCTFACYRGDRDNRTCIDNCPTILPFDDPRPFLALQPGTRL